jgi:hypothetical protein
MKKTLLLFIITVSFSLVSFSQYTNDISKVPYLSRGKIILNSGSSMTFKQLSVQDGLVTFTDSQSKICTYPASDVYKISKTGNYILVGALTCGLSGMAGGILGTRNWKNNEELSGKETNYIVGATVVCTVIGALTGVLIKKDKTVYKSSTLFSFHPGFDPDKYNKMNFNITCRINLK